jgi:hypothetical protein
MPDYTAILSQLITERQQLDQAIATMQVLSQGGRKRRGRPPAWMKDLAAVPRRGRPPGSTNKAKAAGIAS